jgi:hypothetical protein
MYYSYVEFEYVATSFSPARMDLAVKLLRELPCISGYWIIGGGSKEMVTSEKLHFTWTKMAILVCINKTTISCLRH